MEFDADLPYNTEKQEMFGELLPSEKLISPFERMREPTDRYGVIDRLPYNFY